MNTEINPMQGRCGNGNFLGSFLLFPYILPAYLRASSRQKKKKTYGGICSPTIKYYLFPPSCQFISFRR